MEKLHNFWNKLKREWKTFLFGAITLLVSAWDLVIASALDWSTIFSDDTRKYFTFAIPFGFFVLRKWLDDHQTVVDSVEASVAEDKAEAKEDKQEGEAIKDALAP
jgi:hypothetical protein